MYTKCKYVYKAQIRKINDHSVRLQFFRLDGKFKEVTITARHSSRTLDFEDAFGTSPESIIKVLDSIPKELQERTWAEKSHSMYVPVIAWEGKLITITGRVLCERKRLNDYLASRTDLCELVILDAADEFAEKAIFQDYEQKCVESLQSKVTISNASGTRKHITATRLIEMKARIRKEIRNVKQRYQTRIKNHVAIATTQKTSTPTTSDKKIRRSHPDVKWQIREIGSNGEYVVQVGNKSSYIEYLVDRDEFSSEVLAILEVYPEEHTVKSLAGSSATYVPLTVSGDWLIESRFFSEKVIPISVVENGQVRHTYGSYAAKKRAITK